MFRLLSTPHDAEFLLHGMPYFGGSSTDSTTEVSSAEYHLCRVDVRVLFVPAGNTAKLRLRQTASRVNRPADRTGLRAVCGGDLDEISSSPRELVAKHRDERSPSGIQDGPVQAGLLLDPASRSIDRPLGTFGHVRHDELFDHHTAVALGDAMGLDVKDVIALPSDLPMQPSDAGLGFLLILRSLSSSGNHSLDSSNSSQGLLQMSGIRDQSSIGPGYEIHHSAVQSQSGFVARDGICHLDLAGDAHEPLIPVPKDGAGFCLAFKRSMDHHGDFPEFGKMQTVPDESPFLWMWFADPYRIPVLLFPARRPSQPLKVSLPSLVELNQELSADIPGDIGEPCDFLAKFGQFVDLVECGQKDPVVLGPSKAEQTLFESKIPEKPKRIFPLSKTFDLLGRRINAVSESLVDLHGRKCIHPRSSVNSIPNSLIKKGGPGLLTDPNIGVFAQANLS